MDTDMKSPICDMLGIEFPLLAFSHCRDVVAAVSRAGGFCVLRGTSHTPGTIAQEPSIDKGRKHGGPGAALVGAKEHAVRQVAAGVDILVVQGTEAGGHCGEVSTMVLVPEVIKAIKPIRDVPVLAAGGIMTGRQMAACMAMGAAGVWTGSVWLAAVGSQTTRIFAEKMIAAPPPHAVRPR